MAYTEKPTIKTRNLPICGRKIYTKRLPALLALLLTTTPAWSDINYRYRASLGYSFQVFDTDIIIRSQDESINKEIDLENDLGFNTEVNNGWLRGIYRMANRHRISLTYTPTRRTASAVSQKDINIEDNIIKAGTSIGSSTKMDIFDIEYLYSFYKRPNTELSVSGGLYWVNYKFELKAVGEIVLGGSEEQPIRTNYETDLRLNAPLPLLGLSGTYEVNPRWYLHAAARYFYVSIDDIEGQLVSAGLGTDYYLTQHWGLGLSLSTFNLDVEKDGILFNSSLSWKFNGAQVYVVFKN